MDSREILKYWCANRETYPELANLARRYLSCPPGSAASERLFSQAKHVLRDTRLSMLPDNMEMNIFLKKALYSLDYPKVFPEIPEGFCPPNSAKLPEANEALRLLITKRTQLLKSLQTNMKKLIKLLIIIID